VNDNAPGQKTEGAAMNMPGRHVQDSGTHGNPAPATDAALSAALRDHGIHQANENGDQYRKSCFRAMVDHLAATGREFTTDDVFAEGVPAPDHPNRVGAAMNAAMKAGIIRPVGYRLQPAVTARRRRPRVGRGCPMTRPLYLGPATIPWAQALIDGADGPIPQYDSEEWRALPDGSRAKVAACVIAAEAWRSYWDPREVALRARLEIEGAEMYQEPEVWTQDVVESVHREALQPSFADLSRLRGEPEAEARANTHRRRMVLPVVQRDAVSTHRPGDYMGGPVEWDETDQHRPALRLAVTA
jgi:hypothetical protein